MRRIGFVNLVFIYSIAVFLAPIIITGIVSNHIVVKYSKMEITSKNTLLINSLSDQIQQYIDESYDYLNSISNYIIIKKNLYDKSINQFIKMNSSCKCFRAIVLLDNKGQLINSEPKISNESDKDFSLNLFFTNYKNNNLNFSLSDNGLNKKFIIILPVIINNSTVGYIAGFINLDKANLFEQDFDLPKTGINIIITDNKNNIFFNPSNLQLRDKNIFSSEDINYKDDIIINNNNNNNTRFIAFTKHIIPVGWNLILLEDQNIAYAKIYSLRLLIIIIIMIGILITVTSIMLGFLFLFKPIIRFIRDTGKIAHGSREINFRKYTIKELNSLSLNFKKMLSQISKRENELKKSETKYKKLVEDNMDFIFKISRDFKFIFLSHSIENIIGCSKEEFLNNIEKYFEIKNKMNIRARMVTKNIFSNKTTPDPFIVTATNKNGEKIILEIQETPVFHNGYVIEIQGIARDITTRYHVEQEVIFLKNYLYNIIESLPSALITIDKNGYIQHFNTSALKMMDKTSGEIYNKVLWTISGRFECYKKYYDEAITKNEMVEFSEEIKFDNEIKYYNTAFYPLKRQGIKGMVLRIDDVTIIESTELQLKQSQKLETIGTMASGLAHDFNNILGAILGTITLIIYKTRDNNFITYDSLKEDLDIISEASNKATGIIQQLMFLSKNQSAITETVDLNKEIDQVVNLCKTSFPKDIEIIVNVPENPAFTEASLIQIDQMILNLLVNAKDSIKGAGIIKINLKEYNSDVFIREKNICNEEEKYWLITISDNGEGIPDNIKNSIFEPFFSTKGKNKGTGLGLTIVNNIVKQHNGFITFESEINHGTMFKIYLPVINQNIRKSDDVNFQVPNKKKRLVLVIDDEKNIRIMTKKILKECGFDVITAGGGTESVKIFSSRRDEIDAVLLDLIMPVMSGKEIFQELKKIDDNVKVILISGMKNDQRINEILELGAKYFLPKPFTFDSLSFVINKILNEN